MKGDGEVCVFKKEEVIGKVGFAQLPKITKKTNSLVIIKVDTANFEYPV